MVSRDPKKMIQNAKKIFGQVAETIGLEILKDKANEGKFKEIYIERLTKIVGNRDLVINIINKE